MSITGLFDVTWDQNFRGNLEQFKAAAEAVLNSCEAGSNTVGGTVHEHTYPNGATYGIFMIGNAEIGRADKVPDGWLLPRKRRLPRKRPKPCWTGN